MSRWRSSFISPTIGRGGFRAASLPVRPGLAPDLAKLSRRRALSQYVDDVQIAAPEVRQVQLPEVLEPLADDLASADSAAPTDDESDQQGVGDHDISTLALREPGPDELEALARFGPGAGVLVSRTPLVSKKDSRPVNTGGGVVKHRTRVPLLVAMGLAAAVAGVLALRSVAPEPVTVCIDTRTQMRVETSNCKAFEASSDFVWKDYARSGDAPALGSPTDS